MKGRKLDKRQRKGKKKAVRRQERKKKKKQTGRRKLMKGRKLDKKVKKEKCPTSTSTRTVSGGRAINETCLVNILTIVETYYKQVKNFEKQWKRIVGKNKTSVSKGGKMDAFKKPLERLVEAGGGDGSNLSCQGQMSSPGALQMQNLSSILTNCSDQTLLDQAAVLRKCSLANESKTMATALKTCKSSYGNCRKYKEDIIDIVSACSKPLDKQKEKAKALAENVDNMKAAQGAVASVTGSRRFFKDRSRRATPTDCAAFITVVELVITLVSSSPGSPEVSVHCKEIVAAVSIICSEDELAPLKETEMEMEEAAEKLETAYEAILEDILAQTGSTPTEEELESFVPPSEEGEGGEGGEGTTGADTTVGETTAGDTTAADTTAADTTAAETTAAETTAAEATTTAEETTTADETTTGDETTTADETTTTGGTTSTTTAGTTSTTTAATTTTTAA